MKLTKNHFSPNRVALVSKFLTVLCLIAMVPALARGQLSYSLDSDGHGFIVTAYNGAGSAVTIPDTGGLNLPVTGIGTNAFYTNSIIRSVDMPSTVTNIDAAAFFWWTGFEPGNQKNPRTDG